MKKIELTQNQYALVDDEDYNRLNRWKWCAGYYSCIKSYYAKRNTPRDKNGKHTTICMHRIIMNAPSNLQVDHRNHDTLDNRKENLRLCTYSQNGMNRKLHKNTTSQYKGVYWHKQGKKWLAHIRTKDKSIYLGLFKSEIQAAKAYNKKAKELFGEFALSNNIKEMK